MPPGCVTKPITAPVLAASALATSIWPSVDFKYTGAAMVNVPSLSLIRLLNRRVKMSDSIADTSATICCSSPPSGSRYTDGSERVELSPAQTDAGKSALICLRLSLSLPASLHHSYRGTPFFHLLHLHPENLLGPSHHERQGYSP